ncbi:glycogen synthase GlgA [Commensalibacter nepenthis]|uniref:Glycogen synthase n=1 Tax=Commensalibacter nepenthis TaxID=3043872 RepID=A0ABT6QC26_9PROT|nr:glycogen synthase GlgA [Commensalibacter sp. TBRC 10068]MDI2113838.1 glycogen synthase GlgA [Commensalibacter sp. TBRC 10068]
MNILHVCSEFFPLLKTGGLADVMASLPAAQRNLGVNARILLPGFPEIIKQLPNKKKVTDLNTFSGNVTLYYDTYGTIPLYIIDVPYLYDRPGNPYHDINNNDYHDNYIRFALLGYVACELAKGCDGFWKPDVVHAHDWHAGLTCAYLAANNYPAKCIFTIHNIAFSGNFSSFHMPELWLPNHFYNTEGLEFYGQISFLKAAIFYANYSTTVSPTYAQEVLNPKYSHGFDGLLRKRYNEGRFCGILNKVDENIWAPDKDFLITQPYSVRNLRNKIKNKQSLQQELGLPLLEHLPLFTIVSRMTYQKGLDMVLEILPKMMESGLQFIILGQGEHHLESAFTQLAYQYPNNMRAIIGYTEQKSHQLIASADILMVPSRFEPCGLTQLYALKYGTLPLVRRTGGLADTVTDCSLEALEAKEATGFVFNDSNTKDLNNAIQRSLLLWKTQKKWRQLQKSAMCQDFSWNTTAQSYISLYNEILNK